MKTFDSFVDRHTGLNSKEDLQQMLATIGVASVEELLQQVIPQNIRLKKDLNLPDCSETLWNIVFRNSDLFDGIHFSGFLLEARESLFGFH